MKMFSDNFLKYIEKKIILSKYFLKSSCTLSGNVKNMVQPDWPQATYITNVTNIHSVYVILVVFFYATNFALSHLHIMLYVHNLSLVLNFVLVLTRHIQVRLISHTKHAFSCTSISSWCNCGRVLNAVVHTVFSTSFNTFRV